MSNNQPGPYKIDVVRQSLFSVTTPMNQRINRAVSQNNAPVQNYPLQTEGRAKSNIRMNAAIPFDEGFHGDQILPPKEIHWKPQFVQKDKDGNKFK